MCVLLAKRILTSVCLIGLLAVPVAAEIRSVTFKTSRNVRYLWGSAISNLLRSQDGVEEVLSPYQNLPEGLITIKPRKDKGVDLVALVELLEKEVGFEPVTQVTLELRGRFMHREDVLWFEVSDTGQTFTVEKVEAEEGAPPEEQLVIAIAALVDPHSAKAIIVRHWKRADRDELRP